MVDSSRVYIFGWTGRLSNVSYLLDLGADVNLVYHDGRSLLHWAATGRNDILLKVLEKKPNLEAKDVNSFTPLMLSAQQGTTTTGNRGG